jgi:hypothetical protein
MRAQASPADRLAGLWNWPADHCLRRIPDGDRQYVAGHGAPHGVALPLAASSAPTHDTRRSLPVERLHAGPREGFEERRKNRDGSARQR